MPWLTPFDDPVSLPYGRALVTLEDAARLIQKLSAAEQGQPHWQTATEILIKAAETGGGWLMFARIAMLKAINHGRPAPEPGRRKPAKAFRIIR